MIERRSPKTPRWEKYPLSAEERERGVRSAYRCWVCGKPMPDDEIRIGLPWSLNPAGGHNIMVVCEECRKIAEDYYQGWLKTLRGRLIVEVINKGGENK